MDRYKMTYQSMTAFYELGYEFAESKQEAEQKCRQKTNVFY